jgi:predicted transcriptional regulator
VGKTKLTGKLMHLEPDRAQLLEELARKTGIKQSVLMREAIDALLTKHKMLKPGRRRP